MASVNPIMYKTIYVCSNSLEFMFNCKIFLVKPLISLTEDNIVVYRGQTLTLTCVLTAGNPQPSITWSMNGMLLTDTTDGRVRLENKGQVLNIQYVTSDVAGVYTCVADNKVGEDSRTLFVTVIG